MFELTTGIDDLRHWQVMEAIYHKGQDKAWDGKAVLAELVEKHGGVQIPAEQLDALKNIFSVIFWGELAAWKVAAELALELEPLEARMAATSQAHDEARHFYVLHDYLQLLDYTPGELPPSGTRVLNEVVGASSLARKLMGMQLMVEPVALTLFQIIRERNVEPVLSDLLHLFERDEARHVALGVHFLPMLLKDMSRRETLALWAWQLRMFRIQLDGLKELEQDVRALGFHPRDVLRLGLAKQLQASEMMMASVSKKMPVTPIFERVIEFWMELDFPLDDAPKDRFSRLKAAIKGAIRGPTTRVSPGLVVAT
jgi:hypothetical protein